MKILIVDDHIEDLVPWIKALRREGHVVVECDSITKACRNLYLPGYSLIILDRMMPPGLLFGGSEFEVEIEAGYKLFGKLRRYPELAQIPIIVFTNYNDPEKFVDWERMDDRLIARTKATTPSELCELVRDWASSFNFESEIPEVPADEHPNVAPYYVRSPNGNSTLACFENCSVSDVEEIAEKHPWDDWTFGEPLQAMLEHEDSAAQVLRLAPVTGSDDIFGLYLLSPPSSRSQWYRDLIFETAPSYRWNVPDRTKSEVGRAMVTRFLLEFLTRENQIAEFKDAGTISLADGSIRLGAATSGQDFLHAIGFEKPPVGSNIWSLPNKKASEIIKRTQKPNLK